MGITITGGISFSGGLAISDGPPAPPSTDTLLGYAFSDTASSPQDGSVAPIQVSDLTTTFTLTQSQDVWIKFSTVLSRTLNYSGLGACRFMLYIDGSRADTGDNAANYYSIWQGESTIMQASASWIFNLGAGSHTIAIYWVDALAVQATTFYHRDLTVDKLVIG